MAYRRVFAHRRFLKACETALGIVHTAAHGIDIEKAEVNEVWAIKMLVFADCSERVAAFVVPQIRIGHFTATATVKHDDKNSFTHIFTLKQFIFASRRNHAFASALNIMPIQVRFPSFS